MRAARSLFISLLVAALSATTTPASGSAPLLPFGELIRRALTTGTCRDLEGRVICHLEAFLNHGVLLNNVREADTSYEAIYFVVAVLPVPDAWVVEEVIGQRETWRRNGNVTVLRQVFIHYLGPRRGRVTARELGLEGSTCVYLNELPASSTDVEQVEQLLIRLFLSTRL